MPTTKNKVPRSNTKKQKVVQKTRRTYPAPLSQSYDIEEVLVDKILASNTTADNGTSIENLIYSATPSMTDIGYSFGFSVGRNMALKQGESQNFMKVLDRIGLHRSLDHPLRDSLIITSKPKAHHTKNIGINIHVYEAGIIAGYLSMSTGIKMATTESKCIYNGSGMCQFISVPAPVKKKEQQIDANGIINAISHTITDNNYRKLKNEYYRTIAYLPLLKQPVSEQVRKMLLISGSRAAERYDSTHARRIIKNIANYFGATETEVSLRKSGKSIISLKYESYNSIYPYTSMPAALIIGFVSKSLGKSAEVSVSTNRDKTYSTIIEFKNNSA
jgi:predicted hydrocarbon binding protein